MASHTGFYPPQLEGVKLSQDVVDKLLLRYKELYKKEVLLRGKTVRYRKGIATFMMEHQNRKTEMDALYALLSLYAKDTK